MLRGKIRNKGIFIFIVAVMLTVCIGISGFAADFNYAIVTPYTYTYNFNTMAPGSTLNAGMFFVDNVTRYFNWGNGTLTCMNGYVDSQTNETVLDGIDGTAYLKLKPSVNNANIAYFDFNYNRLGGVISSGAKSSAEIDFRLQKSTSVGDVLSNSYIALKALNSSGSVIDAAAFDLYYYPGWSKYSVRYQKNATSYSGNSDWPDNVFSFDTWYTLRIECGADKLVNYYVKDREGSILYSALNVQSNANISKVLPYLNFYMPANSLDVSIDNVEITRDIFVNSAPVIDTATYTDKITASVNVSNDLYNIAQYASPDSPVLVLALFDENDKLIDLDYDFQTAPAKTASDSGITTVPLYAEVAKPVSGTYKAKTFFWKSFSDLKPYSNVVIPAAN